MTLPLPTCLFPRPPMAPPTSSTPSSPSSPAHIPTRTPSPPNRPLHHGILCRRFTSPQRCKMNNDIILLAESFSGPLSALAYANQNPARVRASSSAASFITPPVPQTSSATSPPSPISLFAFLSPTPPPPLPRWLPRQQISPHPNPPRLSPRRSPPVSPHRVAQTAHINAQPPWIQSPRPLLTLVATHDRPDGPRPPDASAVAAPQPAKPLHSRPLPPPLHVVLSCALQTISRFHLIVTCYNPHPRRLPVKMERRPL